MCGISGRLLIPNHRMLQLAGFKFIVRSIDDKMQ